VNNVRIYASSMTVIDGFRFGNGSGSGPELTFPTPSAAANGSIANFSTAQGTNLWNVVPSTWGKYGSSNIGAPTAGGASGGVLGVLDTFTGVDGSAISSSRWATTRGLEGGSAGSVSILTNRARITTAANAGAWVHLEAASMASQVNTDVLAVFSTPTQAACSLQVSIDSVGDPQAANGTTSTGFYVQVDIGTTAAAGAVTIYQNGVAQTTPVVKTITVTTQYNVRFRRVGLQHEVKLWQAGTTEPAAWDATYTVQGTAAQAGVVGISVVTGDGTARSIDVDKVIAA
jgi:hypothetical protein